MLKNKTWDYPKLVSTIDFQALNQQPLSKKPHWLRDLFNKANLFLGFGTHSCAMCLFLYLYVP